VDEHEESAGSESAAADAVGGQPDTAPLRARRRLRLSHTGAGRTGARRVGAAATSRTAGWMVAAALAGALVTLLLEPARLAPSAVVSVPFRKADRVQTNPAPNAVAGSGHRIRVAVPAPRQAYLVPGQPGQIYGSLTPRQMYAAPGQWFAGPPAPVAAPGCIAMAPAQEPFAAAPPPGGPVARIRIGRYSPPKRVIISGRGRRPTQVRIGQLPIVKRIISIPGACAFGLGTFRSPIVKGLIGIPGRCAVQVKGGRLTVPKRILITRPHRRRIQIRIGRLRAHRRVVIIGPGRKRIVAIPDDGPGCVLVRPSGPPHLH
jgi:hypothetical protein